MMNAQMIPECRRGSTRHEYGSGTQITTRASSQYLVLRISTNIVGMFGVKNVKEFPNDR